MSNAQVVAPAETSPAAERHSPVLGWLLVIAAAVAFLFPAQYRVLQTVGTTDNRTLDAAGYVNSRTVTSTDAPNVRRGDQLLDVIMPLQQAAARNKHAADKRTLALLLGLPGMFLLGRSRRRPAGA